MNEQPLDLRRIVRALVRRWLLILVLVWGGSALGYLVSSRQQPVYKARASVLLPPAPVGADGVVTRNINTQVNIARNGNILQRAGTAVNPPLNAVRMRKRINVKALTSDILEVEASAGSATDAARLADAVAKEYVAEATAATSKLTGTAISGLEAQVAKVEQRLQQAKADIDAATARLSSLPASSPDRARQAAIVDSLQLDEVEAARQLASLTDRVAEARLEDELKREGTRLLAPAIPPAEPVRPAPLILAVIGSIVGLVAAMLLALGLEKRNRNLRTRSAIADVVAAPVLASLEAPRRISTSACRGMLEQWEPKPLQSWALRQACMRLGVWQEDAASTVVVVALPGDVAGSLLALQLAVFLSSTGTRTALVVTTLHPTAARIRAACNPGERGSQVRSYLSTRTDLASGDEGARLEPQVTVSLLIADDDLSAIPRHATTTIGVSANFATADTLAATALACTDAGHPVVGVLLANPDPTDETVGDLAAGRRGAPAAGGARRQLGEAQQRPLEPGPPPPPQDPPAGPPADLTSNGRHGTGGNGATQANGGNAHGGRNLLPGRRPR
jgi:capsular polysaccharide biosynthesis protein